MSIGEVVVKCSEFARLDIAIQLVQNGGGTIIGKFKPRPVPEYPTHCPLFTWEQVYEILGYLVGKYEISQVTEEGVSFVINITNSTDEMLTEICGIVALAEEQEKEERNRRKYKNSLSF